MQATRRSFFKTAMSLGVASSAYPLLTACSAEGEADTGAAKTMDLQTDPNGLLDLPPGFTYTQLSVAGEVMDDGLRVPTSHDGMTTFPIEGDADRCLLIRNHEMSADDQDEGPFAGMTSVSDDIRDKAYDIDANGLPLPAGTTTLVFNMKTQQIEKSWMSLVGTIRNCSGGITPWGSWLTCEETLQKADDNISKDHGYVFEVPSSARGLVKAEPLKAMGRFNHEATATDPRTGIVYQTEDAHDSLIYRFLPEAKGELHKSGRLQVLALKDRPRADTRNWYNPGTYRMGERWAVEWLDIDGIDAPDNDLRLRGHAKGAALFARGEGMCLAVEKTGNAIYFACTSGGEAECGQIWKYTPGDFEGTSDESSAPGMLTLVVESTNASEMEMCDNIVASPWGDLVVCEDGPDDEFVRGVTPEGRIYTIARNAHPDQAEFAGACFAPDGETLFVNTQGPHATYAIRGPWAKIARA